MKTEEEEQKEFILYLEDLRLNSENTIKYTSIPNSTYTTSWSAKAKNTKMGLRPGLPDLFLIVNDCPFFVEMKREKGGRLSIYQEGWLTALKRAGIDCYVCNGFNQACEVVKKYLI